ncbi:MAG: RagB/SusD family nutrient uptake outer membrane protein [Sediminibacterium sp.]|nr:RagB/SusD family nutrient uptake outer membrane protein [Sediminibacterium sp.]
MKLKQIILFIFAGSILSLLFTSCKKDFLEKTPLDKLVPSNFFTSEKDLDLYVTSFYQRQMPGGLDVVQADEMGDYTSKSLSPSYIAGAYSSINEGSWNWTNLRNINYFLERYNNPSIPLAVRNHYAGIARFFRAYFYFDKIKTYGDVPWYNKALATNDSTLYKPRDPRAIVMDSVLADLNFASENIYDTKDATSSLVTRQVALAFKSRICLFEGTFRKYHTQLNLSSTADKWLNEAADAAKKVIDAKKYKIYSTGTPTKDYRNLFISENPVTDEVMWSIIYNNSLRRWHDITWKFNSATFGSRWGLNKQFINTYLMTDGNRFTDIPGYDTMVFVNEMKNRDNRLAQTIRALGYKRSDGSAAPSNFGYTFTGYHLLKFSLDDKRLDGLTESNNSITLMRFAEVLLNYAEAKAELNQMTGTIWNQTIGVLRTRAGLPATEPTTPDNYLQSNYFPEIADKYLLEIRRERGIELVYEGLRYADLLRWKKGNLLEKQWKGIYVPAKDLPMDLDGNGSPDVAFVDKTPTIKVPGVIYYTLTGSAKLTGGTKGFITWRDDEVRKFEDKKYFHPISNTDIVLNPKLVQNIGWQ